MKPLEVPDVIPEDWNDQVYGFQLSVASLDDMGFPFRRRGAKLTPPSDPRDHEEFARQVGNTVEETLRIMMGMNPRSSA